MKRFGPDRIKQFGPERVRQTGGALKPVAQFLHHNHMGRLGISNSLRVARGMNAARWRRESAIRRRLYREDFAGLLAENGEPVRPLLEMHDGFAIDTSGTLPHLDRVLHEADEIIAERGGNRTTGVNTYRSFFQDVWRDEDCERFPAFLDFSTSSDVVGVVANYLKTIPVLSTTIPPGIRFVESNMDYDDYPDVLKESQLYHIDYYAVPSVYVLVLLHDTTFDHGPWTFLPRSISQRAKKDLRYWRRGVPYRLDDSTMFSAADKEDVIEFSYPRGSVLFIEPSGCFHFGSRSAKPRFMLMLGYTDIVRTDFSEWFIKNRQFPRRDTDSRLRAMLVDKYYR